MPNYTQGYEKKSPSPKFYNTIAGYEGYNPETIVYYGSDNNVVRIEDTWRGDIWARTISGSNYAQNWPDYTRYEVISAWATISG